MSISPPADVRSPASETAAVSDCTVIAAPCVVTTPWLVMPLSVIDTPPEALSTTLALFDVITLLTASAVPAPSAVSVTKLPVLVPALTIPVPAAITTSGPPLVVISMLVSCRLFVLDWLTPTIFSAPPATVSCTKILPSPLLSAFSVSTCVHCKLMPLSAVTTSDLPLSASPSTASYSSV